MRIEFLHSTFIVTLNFFCKNAIERIQKTSRKNKFIGENAKNIKHISMCKVTLQEQKKKIKRLRNKIHYNEKNQWTFQEIKFCGGKQQWSCHCHIIIQEKTSFKNTNIRISSKKAKKRRCNETFQVCESIHGGSKENQLPRYIYIIRKTFSAFEEYILNIFKDVYILKKIKTFIVWFWN